MRGFHTFCKARTLNVKDFSAVGIAGFHITRHKGRRTDKAVQVLHFRQGAEFCSSCKIGCGVKILEGTFAQTLHIQALNVHIRINNFGLATVILTFRKHASVFSNHQVTAKNHVRSRFLHTSRRINVGRHATSRLVHHQVTAVIALPHQRIAGRKVQDNVCSSQGQFTARRHGSPKIFTQFHAKANFGTRIFSITASYRTYATTNEVSYRHFAKAREIPGNAICRIQQVATAIEVTLLVEFALVGQMNLGSHCNELATLHKSSTVIKATKHAQRQTHCNNHIGIRKCFCNLLKATISILQ